MINKKMAVCALALGFMALAACSPSNPGQETSKGDESKPDTSLPASNPSSSAEESQEPIAGTFTFFAPAAYQGAYIWGESEILGAWPGKALTNVDSEWSKIEVTVTDAAKDVIIFNQKNGNEQTANLAFPLEVGTYYFIEGAKDGSGQYTGEFVKNVFNITGKAKGMVGKTGDLKLSKIGVEGNVKWESEDPTILTVKADTADQTKATWTGIAEGETNVIATAGDARATFKVTIEASEAEGDLTLWVPSTDTGFMTDKVIAGYKAAHSEFKGNIKIKANFGEGDVRTELAKDLDTAADVMCIADDNIRSAANSELLAPLTADEKNAIVASDGQNAVTAGTLDGTLYGYPYRGDNGYILFYNKELFPNPETVESMDELLSAAKEKNVKVYWDLTQGWYAPAPFWANGVDFHLDNDGNMVSTFDSDAAVKAGMAMMSMYKQYGGTTLVYSADNGQIESGFADKTIGACILWNDYQGLKAKIGDNLGYTVLPSVAINGEDKPLHTFNGYKLMSIKAGLSDEKLALAKSFCEYATSAEVQLLRAKELGHGPSNLEVAANEDVKALPFVGQIAEMMAAGHTHAQAANVNDKFWDPMGSIGSTIVAGASSDTWSTFGKGEEGAKKFFASIKEKIEAKVA